MSEDYIICLKEGVTRDVTAHFVTPLSLSLMKGEHLAIVGPNGAGKSLFVDVLLGRYPLCKGSLEYDFSPSRSQRVYENVKYITKVLKRITIVGTTFLAVIAALPIICASISSLPSSVSIGGTGLLIVVGVALETFKQLESGLVTRKYTRGRR